MPSIPIQPARARTYQVDFAEFENLFRDYAYRDTQAAAELAALIDNDFLRGQKWDDNRPLTLAEANISEADVEDGYELYKGQLRRRT